MAEWWFDDFVVGQIERYGSHRLTREEVIDFASRYDPQPFHVDDDAAAASPLFGRLAASGWHTAALAMRMKVDQMAARGDQGMGSPGLDELRWLKPVYPGDTIRAEAEVLALKASASKPDRGAVTTRTTVYNQDDEPVMRQTATVFYRRRPDGHSQSS